MFDFFNFRLYRTCQEMAEFIIANHNGFTDVNDTISYFLLKSINSDEFTDYDKEGSSIYGDKSQGIK
ncbi:MAG: hypothetical protein HFJ58_02250 [Clostridia bacterium]|nr:hypothetical protein [Clostridia bacterium]